MRAAATSWLRLCNTVFCVAGPAPTAAGSGAKAKVRSSLHTARSATVVAAKMASFAAPTAFLRKIPLCDPSQDREKRQQGQRGRLPHTDGSGEARAEHARCITSTKSKCALPGKQPLRPRLLSSRVVGFLTASRLCPPSQACRAASTGGEVRQRREQRSSTHTSSGRVRRGPVEGCRDPLKARHECQPPSQLRV